MRPDHRSAAVLLSLSLCVVICFVLFYFHLWVNREGVKSFYFLLLRGMLRGARESVSLSNNPATSLPTQENPGNEQGGSHRAI